MRAKSDPKAKVAHSANQETCNAAYTALRHRHANPAANRKKKATVWSSKQVTVIPL